MGRQLESKHKEENSREISLAESARELCEVKLELSKKTHEMRGRSNCRFIGSVQFRAPSQFESVIRTAACYIASRGYLRIINGASGSETDHKLFL